MKYVAVSIFVLVGVMVLPTPVRAAESVEVLHKKCMVELRYQFVPSNCFEWIKHSELNRHRKQFLKDWFNAVCKKAMKKDESQVQFHVQHINRLSSECQKDLEVAFEQWSYKSKSDDPERVLQLIARSPEKSGRDLEYRDSHDLEKTKRYRNLRGPRRRLN